MKTKPLTLVCAAFLALGSAFLLAQDEMWPGGTYDSRVPAPSSVLGYGIGERHTPHYLLEKYIYAVAEASDRVRVQVIGQTFQGRNQYHVIISSPENLARLDEIRASIRQLTDPSLSPEEVGEIARGTPAVAMLNYTIHGDEGSGTEASLRTIYQLAAGTDEVTLRILDNVVTIIDPTQNPDGHDRYVNFVNGYLVAAENADVQSIEHSSPWPGARTNAYYFDLNRDWFLMTQVESANRLRAYLNWLPQVAPDLHEMGTNSTYYFAPPMLPHNPIIPEVTKKWWEIYGQANAAAFDRFGWTYYTRESFDYFYSGYGGSLPSMYGGIAMTYEQASASARVAERRDGTLISLRDGAWHHFTTSMATLQTTAERREEKLIDFNKFFVDMEKLWDERDIKEFYIPPTDPARFNKLIQRLQWVGADVYLAGAPFQARGAYNYFSRAREDVTLPAGTAVVPVNQMAGAAVMTMLEPETKLDEEFLKEERKRIDRNESSRFYDITAWCMPLTYGIQAYSSPDTANIEKELIPPIESTRAPAKQIARARVAYLVPPDTNANIVLVGRLLSEGFKVRVARLKFTINDKEYGPGTVVLRVERNPESLHERINELAAETGGYADAADTGYTPEGIDLGSNNVMAIKQPKIAILAGSPTSSYSFGAIRFLFEQVYKLPYTPIRTADLPRIDMKKYNVLIMPSAYSFGSSSYKGILGKGGIAKLKTWIQDGGVLICLKGAVDFAIDEDVGFSKAPKYKERRKEPGEVEPAEPPEEKSEGKDKKAGKKEQKFEVDKLLRTPGAILRVKLDDRSFLSWGYGDFVAAQVNSSSVFVPISDDQGIAAGRYAPEDELLISGHLWPEMKELLAGKAYLWHERLGRGQVICFAEDPLFRASFDGLERLFFNAVFFSLAFAP